MTFSVLLASGPFIGNLMPVLVLGVCVLGCVAGAVKYFVYCSAYMILLDGSGYPEARQATQRRLLVGGVVDACLVAAALALTVRNDDLPWGAVYAVLVLARVWFWILPMKRHPQGRLLSNGKLLRRGVAGTVLSCVVDGCLLAGVRLVV